MKICLTCNNRFDDSGWICPNCGQSPSREDGFISFAPALADISGGFEANFFETLATLEAGNFWFESRNHLIIETIRRYFPAALTTGNYLEIGCGTGFVVSGIHSAFPALKIVGSEIFTQGLSYAQQRLPNVTLIQMDARQIPFAEEFDVIGIFDVLEHIVEDEQVLSQMFQAVKPGGGVIITVPQHRFLWSVVDEYGHHCRRYTHSELLSKLATVGFRTVTVTSFVSLLLPLILASRLKETATVETYDPKTEFRLSPFVNAALTRIMDLERFAIRLGISLPVGSSLLVAAKRPSR